MVTVVSKTESTSNWLDNVLETVFRNHTYVIQFAMVHPKNLKDTTSVEDGGIIIAQTGVTSKFQIENLNLENFVGWNNTSRSAIALQGSIDIFEPLGLNYYDAIFNAINSALPGDILMLTAGTYRVQRIREINQPITIMSESNDVGIFFERSSLFEIHNKGSLR